MSKDYEVDPSRVAEAARDAERMRLIATAFRERNPANPDCAVFDRAATALQGVHTRLLSAAAGSLKVRDTLGATEAPGVAEELAAQPAPASRRPVPPGGSSKIQEPDSHRRARGESRKSIRGGSAGGHGQLPV